MVLENWFGGNVPKVMTMNGMRIYLIELEKNPREDIFKSILISPQKIHKILQASYCAMKMDIKEFENEKI